jgi:hypothetical protein
VSRHATPHTTSPHHHRYYGGQHHSTTVRKDVILALELPQNVFSSAAKRRHRSLGARVAKRFRIIFPNSGLKVLLTSLDGGNVWGACVDYICAASAVRVCVW